MNIFHKKRFVRCSASTKSWDTQSTKGVSVIRTFTGYEVDSRSLLVNFIKILACQLDGCLHRLRTWPCQVGFGQFVVRSVDEFITQVFDDFAGPKCGCQVGCSGGQLLRNCPDDILVSMSQTRDSSSRRCVKHHASITSVKVISFSMDDLHIIFIEVAMERVSNDFGRRGHCWMRWEKKFEVEDDWFDCSRCWWIRCDCDCDWWWLTESKEKTKKISLLYIPFFAKAEGFLWLIVSQDSTRISMWIYQMITNETRDKKITGMIGQAFEGFMQCDSQICSWWHVKVAKMRLAVKCDATFWLIFAGLSSDKGYWCIKYES